jgi:hypothetical protein
MAIAGPKAMSCSSQEDVSGRARDRQKENQEQGSEGGERGRGGKKETRQRNSSKLHYSEIMRGSITLDGFCIGLTYHRAAREESEHVFPPR